MKESKRREPDPPHGRWFSISVVMASVLVIIALFYLVGAKAIARYAERQMNQRLKGYTVHMERAFFHPLSFALEIRRLVIVQQENPDPPIASISLLRAGIHWRELLAARIVGDLLIDEPALHINLRNFRSEEKSDLPLDQKGWQEALQSIYPVKINRLTVRNGRLTYVDAGEYRPLHASGINLHASNVRNIRNPADRYPSPVRLVARIFDKGRLKLEGNADFLKVPHLGIKAAVELTDMDVSYFQPMTRRGNISARKGWAGASGNIEYAPAITDIDFKIVDLKGLEVEYDHLPATKEAEERRVKKAKRGAKELGSESAPRLRIGALRIAESSFAYINRTSEPDYRIFIDQVQANLRNFSNKFAEGPAVLHLTGKFMGTGDTKVDATFRAETKSPDFNIQVAIVNTQMQPMSDLFRAYGNFGIKSGLFSFFSELTVKNNTIDGYVKPMFQGLEVTDRRSPEEKSIFQKLYVAVVGAIAKLLENPQTERVATEAAIRGRLEEPETSTWQVIINLIRNAFIRSILPGFEREVSRERK